MIANGNIEIQEQQDGMYIFPFRYDDEPYTWAIYVFKNGQADLYRKRHPKTGAILGKPIRLSEREPTDHELLRTVGVMTKWCTDSACPLMRHSKHEFGEGCRLYRQKEFSS